VGRGNVSAVCTHGGSEDEVDEALVFPNRALGGVLAVELSGCIIERDPHVDDEEEDPFMSDDYRCNRRMHSRYGPIARPCIAARLCVIFHGGGCCARAAAARSLRRGSAAEAVGRTQKWPHAAHCVLGNGRYVYV